MDVFFDQAARLFDTAKAATGSDCDVALLVGPGGTIRMVDARGWAIVPMQMHFGANTVYRITRRRGHVRVEGRSAAGTACVLQSEGAKASCAGVSGRSLAVAAR